MAVIEFDQVSKTYADGTEAVRKLDLVIDDGEFVILVGPSGCGKSTALRMVAGLEEISSGDLRIGDRVVNDLTPRQRDVAMVFQSYALYPHMNVAENMGFALKMAKVPKPEIEERVRSAAAVLGLQDLLHRKPKALSGGQRQRVAMGRAIVREPQAFLMDEPLSNLDAKLRVQMRADIAEIQDRLGVTTVYVTHDQVEAMTMGDRVAVMKKGVLQQVATPQELWTRPANLFVASFIGSPAMNLGLGRVESADDAWVVVLGQDRFELPDEALAAHPRIRAYAGRDVVVGMRPEHFCVAGSAASTWVWPNRKLVLVELLGSEMLVHFHSGVPAVDSDEVREAMDDQSAAASLQKSDTAASAMFVARMAADAAVRSGTSAAIGFDARHVYLFDPSTGAALR